MRNQILGACALIASLAAFPAAADNVRFTLTHDEVEGSLTWVLPQSPTPDYVDEGFGEFDLDGPLYGTAYNGEGDGLPVEFFLGFSFYNEAGGGGLATFVFPVFDVTATDFFSDFEFAFGPFDLEGDQLFTGTLEEPTFILGDFELTSVCECGGDSLTTQSHDSFHLSITAAVPEPTTWALMIMGFGAAGAALRRRRQVAA